MMGIVMATGIRTAMTTRTIMSMDMNTGMITRIHQTPMIMASGLAITSF